MTELNIDDAMIERAAKAACDYPRCWDGAPEDGWKEYWRKKARRILTAAAGDAQTTTVSTRDEERSNKAPSVNK